MFPLFWWGTCRWLAQDTGLCVDWSGLDTAMSQPTWYTTDWLRTWKYWKLMRVSRPGSHFLYSPLPRPHVRPQITEEGEPGFFPEKNTWMFHQLSNSQQSRGRPLSVNIWYHICGVSADATGWVLKTVLTSDASHVDSRYHVLPSDWKWHFLWPQYQAQKLSWTSDQTKETSYSLSLH